MGAVHTNWLVPALVVGVPGVPVLAAQEKLIALPCGSTAFTRNVTVPPAEVEAEDWNVSVTSGGKTAVLLGPTQMERVPVVWPPTGRLLRESVTVTVRLQLLHTLLPGRAVAVNCAVAEVALLHVPAHEADQL
ncbi:hypothetical protein [Pyxidicoccus caerfyrddinensis]|uniref:hypothetical protein n=1 Tax=Pyxidicoccus caerfyrddinensis TaxID=2709663 RepID=UPI00196721C7|nr:hypothetical protein [Pyxidicoccus caerfyrddinensis]